MMPKSTGTISVTGLSVWQVLNRYVRDIYRIAEQQMRRRYKNSNGFTMAEMLITVAIIVILFAFGFVAVIHHQRNLKRMEMDETAQEIFIAAQNHLTAAQANGQWDSFLEKTTGSAAARGTLILNKAQNIKVYDPTKLDEEGNDSTDCLFYSMTTESASEVQNGAMEYMLPEGAIDETLRGHHFYIEYDAMSGTVYGVFYTDSDHAITVEDAQKVSRTDANARRDYKVDGKRTIIGYYGGALGELKNSGDLYAPSVAVRNAESLVLYVVDKNYYRHTSAKAMNAGSTQEGQSSGSTFRTKLKLTFKGNVSGQTLEKTIDPKTVKTDTDWFSQSVLSEDSVKSFDVVVPGYSAEDNGAQKTEKVQAKYYAIVLDSIVRENGHFADLFQGFYPGEDITITVTLTSDEGGEDVSQTVTVNSLFNSVRTESNFLGLGKKTVVTVSNARHLQNLSSEVSGVDFANKKIAKGDTVDTVSIVRDLYWDEDSAAEESQKTDGTADREETTTAFLTAIASATGMESQYGYCASGRDEAPSKENIQVYPYTAGTGENSDSENSSSDSGKGGDSTGGKLISKGACYGITNTEIKTFEGNNHILAAFRFEGKEQAALINEAADALQISDLVIADATAVVTGKTDTTNIGAASSAAILLAKAKSGSVTNVAVCWYEKTADSNAAALSKQLQSSSLTLASGLQGCRIYSANGIAAAVIGVVDAAAAGNNGNGSNGKLTLENVTVKTISKEAAVTESSTVTAHLGIEGETASTFIGQVTSGKVEIDNSGVTEDNKKSGITIAGNLTLKADKGTAANRAAGAYVGMQAAGTTVTLKRVNLIVPVLEASAVDTDGNGGAAGAAVGTTSGNLTLDQVAVSAHTLEVTGAGAAGGAIGTVSGGESNISSLTILTDKADTDCAEAGQTVTGTAGAGQTAAGTGKAYGIRITAKRGCAGGLIGSTGSAAKVTVSEAAVSGSGSKDQVWSGSSAGGLIGKDDATTTIQSSMVSLYVRSEGNGGNTNGTSSTDGAGGLIGSTSGTTTIKDSYSGGRTTSVDGTPAYKDEAGQPDAAVSDEGYPQGRYNVYLAGGNGGAGGLVGKSTGTLTITSSYSTSSVAVASNSAYAGGLVGEAESLKAGDTYCTGRVYLKGAAGAASNGADQESTGNDTPDTDGTTETGSTQTADTTHFGYYAGSLKSLSKEGNTNYYLKGMNGAPEEAVGTIGDTAVTDSNRSTLILEATLTGADYYASDCPLTKGVDRAQKAYYYDSSAAGESAHYADNATRYPFRTVTTAFARFFYHPVTGAKIDAADQDSAKYAQIGDWEVPEESAEDTFGLIYYERIWDGTTNSLDSTFYYHGYMLQSGENAKTATYKEIRSAQDFVTAKDHYVAESGYLLLVKNGEEKDRYVCLAAGNTDGKKDTETWGQISKKITDLAKYPLSNESAAALSGYTAYDVTFSMADFKGKEWMFAPSGNTFGILMAIREIKNNTQQPSIAAFTYIPFFADAVNSAEKGVLQTVSKATASETDTPQAILRSADQLKYFFAFENAVSNTGFLRQSNDRRIIEQQLDITFDHSKVTFYKDGTPITDAKTDAYQSPTLEQIGWANAVYRSKLRPEAAADSGDYYVLDGLRSTFVTTVYGYGELCDLQVTNIKAEHFLGKISGESASVHDITITDAQFGAGNGYDQLTDGGFAGQMENGTVADCKIINASIYGTGFIKSTTNGGTITRCYIINATIWGDGFITSNGNSIEDCGLYADPSLYNKDRDSGYYQPMQKDHGTYDYVSIGIAPGGSESADNVAGFVQEQTVWNKSIKNCYVAGAIYGSKDVSGFIGNAKCGLTIDKCYANVVIHAGQNASGFARETNDDSTSITNCHALGVIESAQNASGAIQNINNGLVSGVYEAFWKVNAKSWYPFYMSCGSSKEVKNNYYLTDCAPMVDSTKLKDYAGKAAGVSYQELFNLNLYGDAGHADQDHTVGYYNYMTNDDEHKRYPYPMPQVTVTDASGQESTQVQTAYGDWSYQYRYSLLYYEKVDGSYYFHGASTADGVSYASVTSAGDNLENGLLAEGGKTVSESGYVLVTGAKNVWGTFGRADNTGAVSKAVGINTTGTGTTNVFAEEASDSALRVAVKNVLGSDKNANESDRVYVFQLDNYLSYSDTNTTTSSSSVSSGFAIWQTLTQESEGIGITIYSGEGNVPSARFSFQPFFADTVKAANVPESGTTNERALQSTFVTTKDGADDHDYRVRSLSQLENLSKWDRQAFTSVTGAEDLKTAFDKESAKRFSYLSTGDLTTAENCNTHLKIRQDMDIHLENTSDVGFECIDGMYFGRKYGDSKTAVQLQNVRNKDFAHHVTSTGSIKSLVLEGAYYTASIKTVNGEEDIDHGSNEFVEYNYGTLSDITVQNSTLGSAGLVYQNGDVTKSVLKKVTIEEPTAGTSGDDKGQLSVSSEHVYKYTITYEYQKNAEIQTGVIDGCTVKNSEIAGAGMVWRNKGGFIKNSSVEGCNNIGASGFVEYNVSTSVTAPQTETEYQYWVNMQTWQSDRSQYTQASDALIAEKGWDTKKSNGEVTVAVDAIIESCSVKDSKWVKNGVQGVKGSGFVGYNQVNSEGSTSTGAGGEALIRNCIVEDVVAEKSGFAGENTGGAKISRCFVYGSKEKNQNVNPPAMTSSMGNPGIQTSAGFALLNDEASVIESCSFTGQLQGLKIAGFIYTNEGTIRDSYANIIQVWNKHEMTAAGFVYENSGMIEYCHSLGAFQGVQEGDYYGKGKEAGFVWTSNKNSTISNSYAAIYSVDTTGTAKTSYYSLFAQSTSGTFTNCYALKYDGLKNSYSEATGITFVTGDELKAKTAELGDAKGTTVAYKVTGDYPFPAHVDITNYGDWYAEWQTKWSWWANASYSVSLTAGAGIFSEESVAAGKAISVGEGTQENAISLASLDEADGLSADAGTTSAGGTGMDAAVSELVLTLQPEEAGEEEAAKTELDLSQFTPTRKGWKLLGWLITSPSELANQTEKTVVSDIVTKINNVSEVTAAGGTSENGEASSSETEASGAGASELAGTGSAETEENQTRSAGTVYELEKGSKSYHYAPDAVITVTQDVTLAAVWVPDDDTIAKAKAGTLRMDKSGNVLDEEKVDENTASTSDGAKTEQKGAAESQTDTSSADKESSTSDTGTSTTDGTASDGTDAGTTASGDKSGAAATAGTTDTAAASSGQNMSATSTGDAANAVNSSSSEGTSVTGGSVSTVAGTGEEVISDPETAGKADTANANAAETLAE